MKNNKNYKKIVRPIKLQLRQNPQDLTEFSVKTSEQQSVFTAITIFLGRYHRFHAKFGISTGVPSSIVGWNSLMTDPAGSSTVGLYYLATPLKALVTLTVSNLDGASVICSLIDVPFNMAGLITNNYAADLTSGSRKKGVCGPAGSFKSTLTLSSVFDIAKQNGVSPINLNNQEWAQSRDTLGSRYSSFYMQFLRADNAVFTNGVDVVCTVDYIYKPIQLNKVLDA
jgi:hypothetical protein